ncbi:MAG: nicotinate phosphoribosyltransferase [Spirochaeta sp. LUC14_002_19_P3]|nr:MAG: nicotinate phosphoribosyltransferase [Spirochaeta sp. LUC14_002_19_P3]
MYYTPLLTDFYELTMAQGYFLKEKDSQVVFEMFFRRNPFNGGFSIFAGLGELLPRLENLRFRKKDIEFLHKHGTFRHEFLEYLSEYRFSGDLHAMDEGSLIFPGEPVLRVHTSMIEAQLIESLLLNQINFQSLIATKAARIYSAADGDRVLEFGLRRAQGMDGALSASRAACIGGCAATSNTLAGQKYGIPVSGTMAHSWVMSFDSELEAFRAYAEIYPENTVLLIDTYNTLGSGIKNAITVGRELKAKGKKIGVRLDSGDLQYLSVKVREALNEAGLHDAFICVSNDLTEEIVWQLKANGAPIDVWGIGTHLVTGGNDSSFTGVYKLAARWSQNTLIPVMKLSNNPEKITNPGVKQVYRFYGPEKSPLGDLICLEHEEPEHNSPVRFNHPTYKFNHFIMNDYHSREALLKKRISKGRICAELPALSEIRNSVIEGIQKLDTSYKRLLNPHLYKVSLSNELRDLKFKLIDELSGG